MSIEDQRGWIIEDHGITIFPTLFTTRSGCIRRYLKRYGTTPPMTREWWRKRVRNGSLRCRRVELVFTD